MAITESLPESALFPCFSLFSHRSMTGRDTRKRDERMSDTTLHKVSLDQRHCPLEWFRGITSPLILHIICIFP